MKKELKEFIKECLFFQGDYIQKAIGVFCWFNLIIAIFYIYYLIILIK